MQIILLERVENLGQMGDEVKVKPGYARNFLLPQKKALRATEANRAVFGERRAQLEAENLSKKGEAEKVAKKMEGLIISLVRAASEAGQLYGSVTARDISDAVSEGGFTIDRNQVRMDRPLKQLGLEQLRVQLHPEVSVEVIVNIARSLDEAQTQAKLGRALDREAMEEQRDLDDAPAAEELLERPEDAAELEATSEDEAEDEQIV